MIAPRARRGRQYELQCLLAALGLGLAVAIPALLGRRGGGRPVEASPVASTAR